MPQQKQDRERIDSPPYSPENRTIQRLLQKAPWAKPIRFPSHFASFFRKFSTFSMTEAGDSGQKKYDEQVKKNQGAGFKNNASGEVKPSGEVVMKGSP